jgi:hypothetical protein
MVIELMLTKYANGRAFKKGAYWASDMLYCLPDVRAFHFGHNSFQDEVIFSLSGPDTWACVFSAKTTAKALPVIMNFVIAGLRTVIWLDSRFQVEINMAMEDPIKRRLSIANTREASTRHTKVPGCPF